MTCKTQKIELLSPAGDLQAGIAAVKCGADAVYIGAQRFGARESAANSIENIEQIIALAHPYYVKVYVTLNTILRDCELADAKRLIDRLYAVGIDGLIIQDMGLLELELPPLPLIASTQMHNNCLEKVKFLEQAGFARVILARELSLEQIRQIRRQTSVELECFIHGALCVGTSGQCYMSYALGGRSGNRGQCAQPCRRLYSLADLKGNVICRDRYLLSLKDLNLSEYIGDLLDAGVTSFKIEGRLKTAAYVANITAYYRELFDGILSSKNLQKSSSGTVEPGFAPDPAKSFNRGFTDYGVTGKRGRMGSIDTPKSVGQTVGRVCRVAENYFELDGNIELHNADGICFFDNGKNLKGTIINRIEGRRVFPEKIGGIRKGRLIYRNNDHRFNRLLEKTPARRKINLAMRLYETPAGVALEGIDPDGNCAVVEQIDAKQPAQKTQAARQNIVRQLSKLGNTIFTCSDIKIELAEMYFFPLSVLNSLKRSLAEAMIRERLRNRPVGRGWQGARGELVYFEKRLDYTANILNEKARSFYKRCGVEHIDPAAETGIDLAGKIIMKTSYCIRQELGLCPGGRRGGLRPTEPLILTDKDNNRFILKFRCDSCGMDIYLDKP